MTTREKLCIRILLLAAYLLAPYDVRREIDKVREIVAADAGPVAAE